MLKMMRLNFLLIFLGIVLFSSCQTEFQNIEFREIKNLRVAGVRDGKMRLEGDLSFYNPNNLKVKLKKAEINIAMDGKVVALVVPSEKVIVHRESAFEIPVEALLDLSKVNFLNSIMSVLGGRDVKLNFKGYIVVKYWGMPVRIPINRDEVVKF